MIVIGRRDPLQGKSLQRVLLFDLRAYHFFVAPASHQRRDQLHDPAEDLHRDPLFFDRLGRHRAALGEGGLKVLGDLRDAARLVQIGRALEMVVKAAVVQIDRAHDGLLVIADEHLRAALRGAEVAFPCRREACCGDRTKCRHAGGRARPRRRRRTGREQAMPYKTSAGSRRSGTVFLPGRQICLHFLQIMIGNILSLSSIC